MNTAAFDTMAFDKFEVADRPVLSNIEGGTDMDGVLQNAAISLGACGTALAFAATAPLITTVAIGVGIGAICLEYKSLLD